MTVPLYSALEYRAKRGVPHYKKATDKLQNIQRKVTSMLKSTRVMLYETWLKELGLVSLKKRWLREGHDIFLKIQIERLLQVRGRRLALL